MNQLLKKILKLIFVKKTISTNKTINNFFNFIHTTWLPVALILAVLDMLDIISTLTSFSVILVHLILIIRNINPSMFIVKEKISKFSNTLFRFALLIFIFNVILFTWGFGFGFLAITILGRILYIDLPRSQEKMKEQNEFKQQFGDYDGSLNEKAIMKKHIENLFEQDIDIDSLDQATLKKQYRQMAKVYHPDKNDGEHNDRFHSIKQSYDYLKAKVKDD